MRFYQQCVIQKSIKAEKTFMFDSFNVQHIFAQIPNIQAIRV